MGKSIHQRSASTSRKVRWLLTLLFFFGAFSGIALPSRQQAEAKAKPKVVPKVETAPVPHSGDAADDSAVWVHPTDTALSTVIGTDKQGGLAVYNLDGTQIQYLPDGELNNVDLRYNFSLGKARVALVPVTNRTDDSILFYAVNPTTRLLERVSANTDGAGINVYGLCMYKSPKTGSSYIFVTSDNQGTVQQWQVFDNGTGKVEKSLVRTLSLSSPAEGCVADEDYGTVYVGEEDVAIWKFRAEPHASPVGTQVASVSEHGPLQADIEGLTLYRTSKPRAICWLPARAAIATPCLIGYQTNIKARLRLMQATA